MGICLKSIVSQCLALFVIVSFVNNLAYAKNSESDEENIRESNNSTSNEEPEEKSQAVDEPTEVIESYEEDDAYKHKGIHFQLALGAGYSKYDLESRHQSFNIQGASVDTSILVGYWVIENLDVNILVGLSVLAYSDSEYSWKHSSHPGEKYKLSPSGSEIEIIPMSIGVGAAYHFNLMPYDLSFDPYVGVSLGGSYFSLFSPAEDNIGEDANEIVGEHTFGPMVLLRLGNEWWVGDNSGVGIELQYIFAAYPKSHGTIYFEDPLAAVQEYEKKVKLKVGPEKVWWLRHSIALMITASYN